VCTGKQESRSPEPFAFGILHRERASKVFGKRIAQLLKVFTTTRLLPNSIASQVNRLRRLQQRRFVIVSPPAKAQYVICDLIYLLSMYPEILAMMFMLSSMLNLCMLVFVFIMIYFIWNLILRLPVNSNNIFL
jgi:hypothetical protein